MFNLLPGSKNWRWLRTRERLKLRDEWGKDREMEGTGGKQDKCGTPSLPGDNFTYFKKWIKKKKK